MKKPKQGCPRRGISLKIKQLTQVGPKLATWRPYLCPVGARRAGLNGPNASNPTQKQMKNTMRVPKVRQIKPHIVVDPSGEVGIQMGTEDIQA